MQKDTLQGAVGYIAQKRHRRIWKKAVSILACIVVFCTTYALILPALTLENQNTYCGLEEHQHSLECYEKTLICEQEKTENTVHEHTDECYEQTLTCKIEEHTHELSCYSNPDADVESSEDWSHSVSGVKLTDNCRNNLIAVAESQLGYTESSLNYIVNEDGNTKKGYSRYGAWYGDPYGDWNAMFVSFCLKFAEVKGFPFENSCARWVETLQKEEYGFYSKKEDYSPKTGDLIFFDRDGDSNADRVGIVAQLTENAKSVPEKLKIIEGDSENSVRYIDCIWDDTEILGFGKLPEKVAPVNEQKTTISKQTTSKGTVSKKMASKAAVPQETIPHHKTIDAFRDGEENPDTDLDNQNIDKTDLHRLYLDVMPEEENNPVDLLIVLDQSGSMHMNYTWSTTQNTWVTLPDDRVDLNYKDMYDDDGKQIFRDEAIRLVLNGTYNSADFSSKKQEGVISKFLALNSENNVAVVEFHGEEHEKEDLTPYTYNTDASTLVPWMNADYYNNPANDKETYVNTTGQIANATNYCAGLSEAYNVLNNEEIRNNGHKKVLLFLSDGVPTVYLKKYDDGTYKKGGTGTTDDAYDVPNPNLPLYREQSLVFFDKLIDSNDPNAHPDLVAYTVGISKDATDESSTVGVHSPFVMKKMAEKTNGEFIGANSTEEIRSALRSIIHKSSYSNLVIEDTLSEYVDLYTEQPDYKVTMKNADGELITFYEYGEVTTEGKGKLKSVTYNPSTKTVTATFEDSYNLVEDCTYTLSFNIKTDNKAYEHHATNPYPHVGDANTDYGTNKTSSNQPGYYSNDSAKVKYKFNEVSNEELYDLPVVQVTDRELVVQKKWYSYGDPGTDVTNTKSGEVEFKLYQNAHSTPGENVTVSLYRSSTSKLNDYTVENGSKATLTFDLRASACRGLKIGDQTIPVSELTNNGNTFTYTFTVSGDMQVTILYSGLFARPTNCNINFTPPPVISESKPYREEPYKLSSENSWKTVIKNLPQKGTLNGRDVYYEYVVKELSVDGYTTTYKNNDGITVGTITINNKSTTPPVHELPATGGGGTLPYIIGGLLLSATSILLLYIKNKRRKGESTFP